MLNRIFALLIVAMAFVVGFSNHAHAATAKDAEGYASGLGNKVLTILDDKEKTQDQKLSTLEAMFTDTVDVKWVGRFVLGKYWKSATDEQRDSYMDAYRAFLIKHYTSRFTEYSGQTFAITSSKEERQGEFLVRMEIQRKEGKPVLVDYRLRETDASSASNPDFKVFDIIVEGVSLIATQRSEFASVVGREGITSLINKLKNKTARLQAEMTNATE